MKGKFQLKYVLVEDNAAEVRLFRVLWEEVAKDTPLQVFSNGKELLNYFLTRAGNTPHLIIQDLNLPEMSGLDCLVALRQLEVTKYTPVILFSTSKANTDVSRAYMARATSYVEKPSDIEGYRRFIHSLTDYWSQVLPFNPQDPVSFPLAATQSTDLNFLTQVLENLPNMVFVKEAKDLRFVYFNRAGENLLGLNRTILLGKNDYDFFPASQADFFTSRDRTVLSSLKQLDIPREEIKTQKNGVRQLHTRKIPLFLSPNSKEPTHLLGISEDITDRNEAPE